MYEILKCTLNNLIKIELYFKHDENIYNKVVKVNARILQYYTSCMFLLHLNDYIQLICCS